MCGLAGISVGNGQKLPLEALEKSQALLKHRGPHSEGKFISKSDGVGFVHTRLAVLDTSAAGSQPMTLDQCYTLVFNGEIYNFQELRNELRQDGFHFKSGSDTEVLVRLYQLYGIKMLERITGIFAFALWDSRKQQLFLARDAFGVKPLYYALEKDRFTFASELKGLFPFHQNLELDRYALCRYLTFLFCPGPATPVAAVKKLEPGHAMIISEGRIQRVWNWHSGTKNRRKLDKVKKFSINEVKQDLERHLRASVHRQMVSDIPVGAFLSGGLDSSSVVAFAREIKPDIQCFTIDPGSARPEANSDLSFAHKVAEHLKVKLEVIPVRSENFLESIDLMVSHLDEPIADPAALNTFFICHAANRYGVNVMLSGVGGDDIFTGYRRHVAVNYDWVTEIVPQFLWHRAGKLAGMLHQNNQLSRRLTRFLSGANLSGPRRIINYLKWSSQAEIEKVLTYEFKRNLQLDRVDEPLEDFLDVMGASVDALDMMLALEQRFFLGDHNLIYTDRMSMASGVEVRVPFLDDKLVQYVAELPSNIKQRGWQGKWILKKVMEAHLPKKVIYRPKVGFGLPLRDWFSGELRDSLRIQLSPDYLNRHGIFDARGVSELLDRNEKGLVDASYTILSILCIQIWLEQNKGTFKIWSN